MIQATSAKTPSLFSPASISITPKFKLFAMFLIKVPAGMIFENISYKPSSAIMTSTVDLDRFKNNMIKLGYERVTQVESQGEYAIRGGIIDIFPLTEEAPYRIELWDDEGDTIRTFDVESQRSIENVDAVTIYPASEIVLDKDIIERGIIKIEQELTLYEGKLRERMKNEEAHRIKEIVSEFKEQLEEFNGLVSIDNYIKFFYDNTVSFLDYFKEDSIIFIDEAARTQEKARAVELEFAHSMSSRLEKGYILPGLGDAGDRIFGTK